MARLSGKNALAARCGFTDTSHVAAQICEGRAILSLHLERRFFKRLDDDESLAVELHLK